MPAKSTSAVLNHARDTRDAGLPSSTSAFFSSSERVKHSVGECVGAGDVHVNAVESTWALLKHGIYGTRHKVSVKHPLRYFSEATFRLNEGKVKIHTLIRLEAFIALAFRCRITYRKFIA